jgi:alpha,alpha-trehalose-phosphate synthase [UDP-forming]
MDRRLRRRRVKLNRRLVVASNRLPVTAGVAGGRAGLVPSDGGLVRAMTSILRETGGCWVGWPGSISDSHCVTTELDLWALSENYSLQPVLLNEAEQKGYYKGFSNEVIWPLFHGFSTRCSFKVDYWNHYRSVNARFARTIEAISSPDDLVWVHDYHLMLVGDFIRAEGLLRDLAYFHHIPFPPPDIFEILPWRVPTLKALLRFNVIGFQTARDQHNFVDCVRRCLPDAQVRREAGKYQIKIAEHWTTAGVYPISIDCESFSDAMNPAALDQVESIKRSMGNSQLILGIDRLDYTKGIIERLSAYRILLSRFPELRERVTLIQIVVPSREDIAEYQQLRLKIENLVSNVNGEYAKPGWIPVQYFYRSVSQTDLVAYYRTADVAMVTPLRDGMNLVAKEFCASRFDLRGALVLSEFAGAAEELRTGAFIVNPHDLEGLADILHRALCLSESEQALRMHSMRRKIEAHDVYSWAELFAADCETTAQPVVARVAQASRA